MNKDKFINIKEVIKSKNKRLYKLLPSFLINYLRKTVREDDINNTLRINKHLYNENFCNAIIKQFNISVNLYGKENIPKSGRVIFVANHPLGGLDALAVVSSLYKYRPDIKFIVNDILLHLENLKGLFVGVNKHGKNTKETLNNINNLFASDKAVFIFPSGLVSRRKKGKVKDLEWKKTFVMKAKKFNTPIVPIFIGGNLSNFFYNIANIREKLFIKTNIEMLYLVGEQYKLKNSKIDITVGNPITLDKLDKNKSNLELAQWIKNNKVYTLSK